MSTEQTTPKPVPTPEMIDAGIMEVNRQLGGHVFEGLVLNVADIYRAMRVLDPAPLPLGWECMAVLARQFSRAQERVAVLERVIAEAICFPSAGLQDSEIRWLHDKIVVARNSHELRLAEKKSAHGKS